MGEARWEDQRNAVRNAGARLIEASMPLTIGADDPVLEEHMAILSNPDNYPMLVHCQHGVTRTAKVALGRARWVRSVMSVEMPARHPSDKLEVP